MFLYKLKKISRRLQAKIGIRLLKQKKNLNATLIVTTKHFVV